MTHAFEFAAALISAGLVATLATPRWSVRQLGRWRTGHLTAAALYGSGLTVTVSAAVIDGWSGLTYAAVAVHLVSTATALVSALLLRPAPGAPPGSREPLPQQDAEIIPLRPRRRPPADERAA